MVALVGVALANLICNGIESPGSKTRYIKKGKIVEANNEEHRHRRRHDHRSRAGRPTRPRPHFRRDCLDARYDGIQACRDKRDDKHADRSSCPIVIVVAESRDIPSQRPARADGDHVNCPQHGIGCYEPTCLVFDEQDESAKHANGEEEVLGTPDDKLERKQPINRLGNANGGRPLIRYQRLQVWRREHDDPCDDEQGKESHFECNANPRPPLPKMAARGRHTNAMHAIRHEA